MTDSKAKKSDYVRVSSEDKTYLKQLSLEAQMRNGGVEVPMGEFVSEALELHRKANLKAADAPVIAQEDRSLSSKEQASVDQFLAFLRSAPKEDVHMVLSLMARFSSNLKENSLKTPERRFSSR